MPLIESLLPNNPGHYSIVSERLKQALERKPTLARSSLLAPCPSIVFLFFSVQR
jgi:hypothetical protein